MLFNKCKYNGSIIFVNISKYISKYKLEMSNIGFSIQLN